MTVYVDDVRHRFAGMVMCHLWADTLDELDGVEAEDAPIAAPTPMPLPSEGA